ncbi:MAG: hypothetical protein NC131_01000 [Roseburia sp.]|nr:hypothetical protein [Roseburia sp.]
MSNSQIKSKKRVQKFAEVFTNEREVKAMCDLIPCEVWQNIESTFLEPACGTGNFLAEILERKLKLCESEKDGLKALNSLFGIDIQEDNVKECRERLLNIYKAYFPKANEFALTVAMKFLKTHIVCDDMLNPQTETVKSWGITADKNYVKFLRKRKC